VSGQDDLISSPSGQGLGYGLYPALKNYHFLVFYIPYDKSFIDQACSVKMAGYWPRSSSMSITMQKKNKANIQPS